MHKPLKLTEDEQWQAVKNRDAAYDGQFFFAVRTTGIVCRPGCRAKTPLKKNVTFFSDCGQAIQSGFRPCKLCRPDLKVYDPNQELVDCAKEILNNCGKIVEMSAIAKSLGVRVDYLSKVFREHTGNSLGFYLSARRIERAKEMLDETDLDVLEVALESGFRSLSNFYTCFKEHVGCTPRSYRNRRGEK